MGLTSAPVYPTSGWQASDYGYKAMAFDPGESSTTSTPLSANGIIWFTRVAIRQRCLVSNIVLHIFTAGATLTSGQSMAALYNSSGTLLSATASTSTTWASSGTVTTALTSAQDCLPGLYDVAFFSNGTTRPAMLRSQCGTQGNLGLTSGDIRFGTADTGRTTSFPGTLGAKTSGAVCYWAALS